jgi:Skp family chaperone for outer membrane proteins
MKKTSLMALALCATASLALAQGAPAARPAGDTKAPRIAVIDMQRISSDSALGKTYAEKISALEKEIQTEGTKKQAERQAFLEDGQADLQRMRERAQAQAEGFNAEFQQKIRPSIEAVAKDKGIDIILRGDVALTLNDSFDISKDVIAKSDELNKTAAAAPAAPRPAPAAPRAATPAAPKPSPKS